MDTHNRAPTSRHRPLRPVLAQDGFHIHIVREGSPHHTKHILFRDGLRTHPADADAYRELKIRLSEKYKDNRVDYTESKTAFIDEIVKKAK